MRRYINWQNALIVANFGFLIMNILLGNYAFALISLAGFVTGAITNNRVNKMNLERRKRRELV